MADQIEHPRHRRHDGGPLPGSRGGRDEANRLLAGGQGGSSPAGHPAVAGQPFVQQTGSDRVSPAVDLGDGLLDELDGRGVSLCQEPHLRGSPQHIDVVGGSRFLGVLHLVPYLQCQFEVAQGVVEGEYLLGGRGRSQRGLQGLTQVVTHRPVMRQFTGWRAGRGEHIAHPAVGSHSAGGRQLLVERLPDEGMREGESAMRPADLHDQPGGNRLVDSVLHHLGGVVADLLQQVEIKLPPDHRRQAEDTGNGLFQPLQTPSDHLPQSLGYAPLLDGD